VWATPERNLSFDLRLVGAIAAGVVESLPG
jgi:hypothetical protein